ncbi:MAG TPA: hypothetical protein VGO93_09900, partial [Candidatus Xenobia bacterium]
LEYSAPEQFTEGGSFDGRSMVYAVGALMYHMLTRRNPQASPFQLAPVGEFNPTASRSVVDTVHRATQNDPGRRFQTLADLRRKLQSLARDYEAGRHRAGPSRPLNLQRVILNGALAFFFVALIGGVMLLFYYLTPR